MLEVDKRIGRPEAAMQLFPCDHTSGALQQDNENLKGLALQLDFGPISVEFTGVKVCGEFPKTKS